MSYILEALKKVEQKREQQDASKLPTFLSEQTEERKKPLIWPFILAAALFVNAGLALRLFGPWWTHEEEPSSISPSPPKPAHATPAPKEKEVQTRIPPAKTALSERARPKEVKKSQTQGVRHQGESAAKTHAGGQHEATVTVLLPPAPKAQTMPQEARKEVQVPVQTKPPAAFAGKVVSAAELPPAIRSSLPQFRISGHAYSPDPQTRVVRVNEKILQEGQELSPGLKLEEIVPDGIVMSYSGYRFHVGLKETP